LIFFNLLLISLLVDSKNKQRSLSKSYSTLRMFVRNVNFRTSPDLIKYVSSVFLQYANSDIYFTYKNIYVPSGFVEVFKDGELSGQKRDAEVENLLYNHMKIVILPNIVVFYEEDNGFFKDIIELLKLLFTSSINYDILYSQAGIDELTQLHNRLALEAYVKEIYPILSESRTISFIMCDVDEFKHFNDVYGHDAGDIILQRVSGAIRKNIKASDFAFRFGGDEMAVIVEGDKFAALKIAKRIANSLSENGDYRITLSVGIAEARKQVAFEALKKKADEALYRAKKAGRNKIILDKL